MPTSLSILASSAIEDSAAVEMQPSRFIPVHVAIAPHPGPLVVKPEPPPYSPTEQSQYRHRSHRARPLIPNKCEECVTARQKCTWSSNSESCDRCRRLEKRCHLRKSTVKEEPLPDGNSDTAMSQSEIYPLSDSAAAALALTELSAASEDRKSPVKTNEIPTDHVSPYQVGGRPVVTLEPSPYKSPTRLPAINYPPSSPTMDKNVAGHKRKVSRKGNNPHGNVGTYKCARCREFKAKCLFSHEDRPCKRCALAGKSCGPKTLARDNENHARTQSHKPPPPPPRQPPPPVSTWPINKPLLPRIFELVGANPGMVSDIAAKLTDELTTLHARVAENSLFPAPFGRPFHAQLPPISGSQRNSRAVSLPPIMPEHDGPEERVSMSDAQDSEYRSLGDGLPQYQPFCTQCALDQGMAPESSGPASRTHFNQHPKKICREHHPHAVRWRVGCHRHRGVLDGNARCLWCSSEKGEGRFYASLPMKETEGYPGDDFI